MIRFRNPGTQYSTQIQVIKHLYEKLHDQSFFTLEDMAVVIAQSKLMTAYGYVGDDALRLSNTDQESMNSALMNAKMYAEVFRMLGWVTPYDEKASYPLVFTYIGIHMALSKGDAGKLYEQCVLGINNPTELADKVHYDEKLRFFKCALRSFIDLDGIMYKHELCLGPMSVNDIHESEYKAMIKKIKGIRGNHQRLTEAFKELADSLGMKTTPVDNCTRLPIAFMKNCGWIESVSDKTLYNKTMSCLKITPHGIETYERIKDYHDLRLDEFNTYSSKQKEALIRLGTYSMLIEAGYNLENVADRISEDKKVCSSILKGKDLLFSPCQTLRRTLVESALGIHLGEGTYSIRKIDNYGSEVREREAIYFTNRIYLNLQDEAAIELLKDPEDIEFLQKVENLQNKGFASKEIVEELFKHYIKATQTTFYPLIATLFKIMGFNCSISRPGDNGARWDAIIDDPIRSIPIEIKSPTEEQFLSIKAIRQALENKIILLSRGTHATSPDTSTLAIGYYMPNERAEVVRLISDFKETYGYKIGVLDLKSLLSLSISILVDGKGFDKEMIYSLEGLVNADI